MIERLLILLVIALAVVIVSLLMRSIARTRVDRVEGQDLSPHLRRLLEPHDSGILYFYGPHCSACARQAAVLDGLAREAVRVVRLDATVEREVAGALSVMTIPSTAVVDGGRVTALNLGYAGRETLLHQLERP